MISFFSYFSIDIFCFSWQNNSKFTPSHRFTKIFKEPILLFTQIVEVKRKIKTTETIRKKETNNSVYHFWYNNKRAVFYEQYYINYAEFWMVSIKIEIIELEKKNKKWTLKVSVSHSWNSNHHRINCCRTLVQLVFNFTCITTFFLFRLKFSKKNINKYKTLNGVRLARVLFATNLNRNCLHNIQLNEPTQSIFPSKFLSLQKHCSIHSADGKAFIHIPNRAYAYNSMHMLSYTSTNHCVDILCI